MNFDTADVDLVTDSQWVKPQRDGRVLSWRRPSSAQGMVGAAQATMARKTDWVSVRRSAMSAATARTSQRTSFPNALRALR